MTAWEQGCPKSMRFGPCGGVEPDGTCELGDRSCPFVELDWSDPAIAAPRARQQPEPVGLSSILVDVRAPRDPVDLRDYWLAISDALQGAGALIGEHADNRVSDDAGTTPTEQVIEWLATHGVQVWVTITGRHRTVEQATVLMSRYRDAGAAVMHCVTGDHPAAMGVAGAVAFGAESFTLSAAATEQGLTVSVAESPAAPGQRALRLARKEQAGAAVCVLNHSGDIGRLVEFVAEVRRRGCTLPVLAPVPMVSDARHATALVGLPGLLLPPGMIERISSSPDPHRTAMGVATEQIASISETGVFHGCNLSGGSRFDSARERIDLTARYVTTALANWQAPA